MKANQDGFLIPEQQEEDKVESPMSQQMRELGETIATAVRDVAEPAKAAAVEADPALKAITEVAGPVARLAGGVSAKAFVGLWGWMRRNRTKDARIEREKIDLLKEIKDKPVAQGHSGGGEGGIGLGKGVGLAAGGGILGAMMGRLGKLGKGLLKRIPLLGALASLGFGALDYASAKTAKDRHKAVGGTGGTLIGAGLGFAVGGPFGAVVGGVAGNLLGEFLGGKFGEYAPVIEEKLEGLKKSVVGAWDGITLAVSDKMTELASAAKKTWADFTGWLDEKTKPAQEAFHAVTEKVGDVIGPAIDKTIEAAAPLKEKVGDAIGPKIDRVLDSFSWLKGEIFGHKEPEQPVPPMPEHTPLTAPALFQAAASGVKSAQSIVKRGANMVKGWVLGKTSEQFETGGRGVGTVSHGKGDRGGVSYGSYQLATNTGTLDAYLRQSKYGKEFTGLKGGTDAFTARWKEIAKRDPEGFKADQHEFIKRSHFNPAASLLRKQGVDVLGRGPALQDAVWSTAVQFGPSATASMIEKATGGKASKMTDLEVVTALQNYKATHNDRLFSNSSPAVRAGTLNRARSELASLSALAKAPTVKAPSAGMPADMPAVRVGVNNSNNVKVQMPTPEVGQNVTDAKTVRVVSGGLA